MNDLKTTIKMTKIKRYLWILIIDFEMSENATLPAKEKEQISIKNSENKWYAVYTRPRAEKLVHQRLVETGIETFLPLQKTYRIWSDRKKMVQKVNSSPLFIKSMV
jgi:hypothetical protein